MKDRKIKQVLSRGWYQWKGERHKDRVKEGQYGGRAMHLCMKVEQRDLLKLF
jgi:hypothetical protein